jgi:hypothetical protein
MAFKVPLMVCPEDGQAETIQEIAIVEKDCQRIGQIGLSLAEAKALLQAVQQSIVERQTSAFLATHTLLGLWHPASHQGVPCPYHPEALWHHHSHKSMDPPLPVYTPHHGHRQSFNRTLAPAHCPGTPLHGNQVGVLVPLASLCRPSRTSYRWMPGSMIRPCGITR